MCHKIFEELSTALHWILINKFHVRACVHILDDFLFIDHNQLSSHHSLKCWFMMTKDIGIPVSMEKTTQPNQVCIFAGIELCSVTMVAKLPVDKLRRYGQLVNDVKSKRKITLLSMQQIVGCLQFATSVVTPGRAFLRRLIDQTVGVKRPFHFVTINASAKADLNMWQDFLLNHNGKTFISEQGEQDSTSLHLYTDASSRACAAVFGRHWFVIPFPDPWKRKNIAFLELFPIVVALKVYGPLIANSKICFHTDNEAISVIINKQTSKDKEIMSLVRPLVMTCLSHNIRFRSRHIPGKLNILPDSLSRLQVSERLLQQYGMRSTATPIPDHLLPENWTT